MIRGTRLTVILVATACIAFGCGGEAEQQTPAHVPADLVPTGATVYVQIESLDALGDVQALLSREFGGEADFESGLDDMLGETMDMNFVDSTRPLGITIDINQAMNGRPVGAFVIPVNEADQFVSSLELPPDAPEPIVEGGYVGVPMSASYVRGEAPNVMTRDLLAGEVTVRLDLDTLLASFRPMIDGGLEQARAMASDPSFSAAAGGMDMSSIMELYFGGIRAFLDSAESLDLALDVEESRMDLNGALTVREGSVLAEFVAGQKNEMRELAGYVDPDASIVFLWGMDMRLFYDEFRPFMDEVVAIYPEPLRETFLSYMESYEEIARLLGGGMAGTFDLQPSGMRAVYHVASDDPAAVVARIIELLQSRPVVGPGISFEGTESVLVEGFDVTRVKVAIDYDEMGALVSAAGGEAGQETEGFVEMMRAMYGPDGVEFAFAASGDVVTFVLGGDEEYLRNAVTAISRGPATLPPDLERAVANVEGSRAGIVMSMDLARFMADSLGTLRGMEGMPSAGLMPDLSDHSLKILVHGAVDGRVWRGGVSVDVAEISAIVTAFEDD